MRILFLGLALPKLDHYLNMYTELMVELHRRGHEVVIVGPGHGDKKPTVYIERGIKVLRVPTLKLFNVGLIQKGLANLLLPYQYKRALRNADIPLDFDLVVMPTPPVTLVKVCSWLKRSYGSRIYLILRDIFPQNAVDLKMMKKGSPVYAYFRRLEKKMYAMSDIIGCMSPANIEFVKEHNPEVAREKLTLLPNWTVLHPLSSREQLKAIRAEYGMQDKFIVLFGGNIGKPQRMANIVALAAACKDIEDIFFMVIGGGNEKDQLVADIASSGLKNIRVYDSLSRARFFEVLQMADVGLISLNQDFTIPNYPSKSLAYFNAKVPILASVDPNTDFGRQIEEINAGLWAAAGNTQEVKAQLLKLYENAELRLEMGENGYRYLQDNLTVELAAEALINQVTTVE